MIRPDPRVLTTFFALVFSSLPVASMSDANDLPDCAFFRQAPTITREIQRASYADETDLVALVANAGYWIDPFVPSYDDGRPNVGARFEIMLRDWSAPSAHYRRTVTSPFEFEHLSLIVLTGNDRPAWGNLIGVAKDTKYRPGPIEIPAELDPTLVEGMQFDQVFLDDFQRVFWPQGQNFLHEGYDLFVGYDDVGKIDSVMRCRGLGTVPNPTCDIFQKFGTLRVAALVNRSSSELLSETKDVARRFVACLIDGESFG